jgi:ribonuclease P protein component
MVVPKRHVSRAVARNRVKRVIRESFRGHQALLAGLDVVVMARSGTAAHGNQHLRESLRQHWRRAAAEESWKVSE